MLNRILAYRPELAEKIQQAKNVYGLSHLSQPNESLGTASKKKGNKQGKKQISSQNLTLNNQDAHNLNGDPFVQRLVTYLQAGQYKLIKAYRSIASQEQKERLVNSITDAIRRSLNPDEIMQVAVQELGLTIHTTRCLIYYCKATDSNATITHEYLNVADNLDCQNVSLLGQIWALQNNPLFQEILQRREPVYVTDTSTDPRLSNSPSKP